MHLVGRQGSTRPQNGSVWLFQPLGVYVGGGRVAVLTDASLTAELAEDRAGRRPFRPAVLAPPADWPWPAGRAPAPADALAPARQQPRPNSPYR